MNEVSQPVEQVKVEAVQTPEPVAETPPQEAPKPVQDKSEEINWARARNVLKAQAAEIEELKRTVEKSKKIEPDDFEGIDKDDYITLEQAQRLAEKKAESKAKEIAQNIVEERLRVVEGERLEEKTRSKFTDYDYVIDNFAIPLIENNPALAQAIKSSPNWAEMAYRYAKSSPEYEAEMAKRQTNTKAVEKVTKNTERPLSANATGSSLKEAVESFSQMSPEDVWRTSRQYARRA